MGGLPSRLRGGWGQRRRQLRGPACRFDGDGDLDVALGNDRTRNLDGCFERMSAYGTGDLDIVVANVNARNAVYFDRGLDAPGFREFRFGCEDCSTYGVAVGDLNGDGFPKIVTANSGAPNGIFVNVPARYLPAGLISSGSPIIAAIYRHA